jgi:hypothetical protein
MSLKATTVVAFVAVIMFGILLHFSKDHSGTSTPVKAAAFSRGVGETFQCTHGFLATFTSNDAKKAGGQVSPRVRQNIIDQYVLDILEGRNH